MLRLLGKIERLEGVSLLRQERARAGRPEHCYSLERVGTDAERARMVIAPDEMRLLHLCREVALPLLPPELGKKLEDVLRRATTLVPQARHWQESGAPLLRAATLGYIDYGPQHVLLNTLLQAIEQKKVCEILYTAQGKTQRSHEMAVTSLCGGRHAIYANGWKVREKGRAEPVHPLFLAVHRMQNVILTRRTHDMADRDDTGHFGIIEEEAFEVRVFFDAELETYIRERRFSKEQSVTAADNGIVLTFTAHSDMEVVAWLLGFGAQARVLEPAWLVDRVRQELSALCTRYGLMIQP